MFRSTHRIALALLVSSSAAAAQDSWFVDDNGPADFAEVQAAIDAAAPGDTVVVRAGSYGKVAIEGKGLQLVSDGTMGPTAYALGSLFVRGLPADQRLLIRGLSFQEPQAVAQELSAEILDCMGPVFLEDCRIEEFGAPSPDEFELLDYAGGAAAVRDSTAVTFVRCWLRANYGTEFGFAATGEPGLDVHDSNVYLFDSSLHGAFGWCYGSSPFAFWPGGGSAGLRQSGGVVYASGCGFEGGDGAFCGSFGQPNSGGSGVQVIGSQSQMLLFDCLLTGGQIPIGVGGVGETEKIDAPLGAVTEVAGVGRSFVASVLTAPLGPSLFAAAGEPGDSVFVVATLAPAPLFPVCGGALYFDASPVILFLGALQTTGPPVLTVEFQAPPLAPHLDALTIFGQGVFIDVAGECFLGSPSALTIVR